MPKGMPPSGVMVTDDERKRLSSNSQGALGRAAMGTPMTDQETKEMAHEIKEMRGRDMFDSPQLQRALYKIKSGGK